jgi:hypothetical protein
VAEFYGLRNRAEQPVNRGREVFGLQPRLDGRTRQIRERVRQGFLQSRRRLAGGRGELDPQIFPARLFEQQRQQPRHRPRLAGAGAAGDDGKPLPQRRERRDLLPVNFFRRAGK